MTLFIFAALAIGTVTSVLFIRQRERTAVRECLERLRVPEDRTFSMNDAKEAWDAASRAFNKRIDAELKQLEEGK